MVKALLAFLQLKKGTDVYMPSLKWKETTLHTPKTNPENNNQSELRAWCSWVSHVSFVMETKEQPECVCVFMKAVLQVRSELNREPRAGLLPVVEMIALVGSPEGWFRYGQLSLF